VVGAWTKDRLFAYRERFDGDAGEACRSCDTAFRLLLEYLQAA
jgi:hypothetical protein